MAETFDADAAIVNIVLVRGDDFSMVVDVEGDRHSDAFAAACRPERSSATVSFTVTVGAYDSGDDSTPVTMTMADTVTDDLAAGFHLWDLEWTAGGTVRTIARGQMTVIADVTP